MGGTVKSAGIDCGTSGSTCRLRLQQPAVVQLDAVPDSGFKFVSWDGDCAGSTASLAVQVTGLKQCGAVFWQQTVTPTAAAGPPYTLTVIRPGGGRIWGAGIDCGTMATVCQATMPGAVVMGLLATPDPGYAFAGWTGDCAGTDPSFAVALSGPRTCGAVFAQAVSSATKRLSPYIAWPTPAAIAQGTALSATQLNAAAKFAGSFLYSPPAGTVLPAGTHTLSVRFTPADTTLYNTVAAYRSLVVNATTKITPYIAWATPAAITQGTPLGATQLNAAAKFAGAFVYSPPAGTVLAAGTHTLRVTFTPADPTRYTTATATTALVVNPPPS
jgi:hypothetical protein